MGPILAGIITGAVMLVFNLLFDYFGLRIHFLFRSHFAGCAGAIAGFISGRIVEWKKWAFELRASSCKDCALEGPAQRDKETP
jgi:hypothetical protein